MHVSNASPDNAPMLVQIGASLDIHIGVPATVAGALISGGRQAPPPVRVLALVDTGAAVSGVDRSVAGALGLQPSGSASIGSAHGANQHAVYAVSIEKPGIFKVDPLPVIEVDMATQPHKALIGRDLLRHMILTYIGTSGVWVLSV